MPKRKKAQIFTAGIITLGLLIITPTYSWFSRKQEMARYEKISSPNTLCITAARREDVKNFQVGGIDVGTAAYWVNNAGGNEGRKTYQDYVFAVAGDYVVSYTLQLAHTTNNNYKYEIYEAQVMDTPPEGKVLDKDYIEYTLTERYDPSTMANITANPLYEEKHAGDKLYYSLKKADDGTTPVSLNSTNYKVSESTSIIKSEYTIGGKIVQYNGHYLNMSSTSDFLANYSYHSLTYGSDTNVQAHSEPLYWQATNIIGGDPTSGDPFYHEYILRISWETTGDNQATTDFKDTDMIYITAKAE